MARVDRLDFCSNSSQCGREDLDHGVPCRYHMGRCQDRAVTVDQAAGAMQTTIDKHLDTGGLKSLIIIPAKLSSAGTESQQVTEQGCEDAESWHGETSVRDLSLEFPSAYQLIDNIGLVDVCQAFVATAVVMGQFFVIHTQQMQDGGMIV